MSEDYLTIDEWTYKKLREFEEEYYGEQFIHGSDNPTLRELIRLAESHPDTELENSE